MWLVASGRVVFPEENGKFSIESGDVHYELNYRKTIDLTYSPPPKKKHLEGSTTSGGASVPCTSTRSDVARSTNLSSASHDAPPTICYIYNSVPTKPMICTHCGHIMCTGCSEKLQKPFCPLCRAKLKLVQLRF